MALVPADVKKLIDHGCDVYVERGAGERVEFPDQEYEKVGAKLQSNSDIYKDKDLVIKFKGPSMAAVSLMNPGTSLFCMAHFHSFPERAKKLEENKINVIAMENILESPKVIPDADILSKVAMKSLLLPYENDGKLSDLDVRIIGFDRRIWGALQRTGNRNTKTLSVIQVDIRQDELTALGPNSIYFYDSKTFNDPNSILPYLLEKKCVLFDLEKFEETEGPQKIEEYRKDHPPLEFGRRRIQCLHETGQAGARYGFHLLREESIKKKSIADTYLSIAQLELTTGAFNESWGHIS